jgi:uncharacterized protein with ParB-like and HNH nuclease domain
MAQKHFTPSEVPVLDLLTENTYTIPAYQRPYSWRSEGKNSANDQVNQFWDDLYDTFIHKPTEIYFLGSMVTIAKGERRYEVVDGQQRLTTLSLLFASMRCFYKWVFENDLLHSKATPEDIADFRKEVEERLEGILFNKVKESISLRRSVKKLRIEKVDNFDYDDVLTKVMSCEAAPDWKSKKLDDYWSLWKKSDEKREIVERYFDNRNFLLEQLKTYFVTSDGFVTDETMLKLDKFFEFLIKNVFVINITAESSQIAYQIFEILNNRGLPLTSKDLFRNFIISELNNLKIQTNDATLNPVQQWHILDSPENQFDDDFVNRYLEAKLGKKQRYAAFNEISDLYNTSFKDEVSGKKQTLFFKEIQSYLKIYTQIIQQKMSNDAIDNYLDCILNGGNRAITISLLVALFKNFEEDEYRIKFLKAYECFVLHLLIATKKRFKSADIYETIQFLNKKEFDQAINKVKLSEKEADELKDAIKNEDFRDNTIAKLFIARFYWAKEQDFDGDDTVFQTLLYQNTTLEHIIPQTPDPNTNWQSEFTAKFRKEMTYKLGNMTLLTKSKNSAAKNFDWKVKRDIYTKTKLQMTLHIAEQTQITPSFLENHHKHIVATLIKALDL